MNKNYYKRVPFDIELAKRIQSGEVKGRIVTSENLLVRIVDFNLKDKTDSIVYIGTYANEEQEFIQTCNNEGKSFGVNVLYIELPEETPKQPHELTFEELQKISWKDFRETLDRVATCRVPSKKYTIPEMPIYKETPKHEFKPFDKVLVRADRNSDGEPDIWVISLFMDMSIAGVCVINGEFFDQVIPYEGNEHLLGTTDNPK